MVIREQFKGEANNTKQNNIQQCCFAEPPSPKLNDIIYVINHSFTCFRDGFMSNSRGMTRISTTK